MNGEFVNSSSTLEVGDKVVKGKRGVEEDDKSVWSFEAVDVCFSGCALDINKRIPTNVITQTASPYNHHHQLFDGLNPGGRYSYNLTSTSPGQWAAATPPHNERRRPFHPSPAVCVLFPSISLTRSSTNAPCRLLPGT